MSFRRLAEGPRPNKFPKWVRPHNEPVTSAKMVNDAPMGAEAAETACPTLMRQMRPRRHRRPP